MTPDALAALSFTAEQRMMLFFAWILFFLVPAFGVRAHALRHGRPWLKWFVLTLLTSLLGVVEYWEDKAVTERRAKRAAAKAAKAAQAEPSAGEAPPTAARADE